MNKSEEESKVSTVNPERLWIDEREISQILNCSAHWSQEWLQITLQVRVEVNSATLISPYSRPVVHLYSYSKIDSSLYPIGDILLTIPRRLHQHGYTTQIKEEVKIPTIKSWNKSTYIFGILNSKVSLVSLIHPPRKRNSTERTHSWLPIVPKVDAEKSFAHGDLLPMLTRFSDTKKRIAVLSVSAGMVSFATNWICYLKSRNVNLENFLLIAEDLTSFHALMKVSDHVYYNESYSLQHQQKQSAATYGELRYQEMIHIRVSIVLQILQAGYHVLAADIDAVWNEDPFLYFDEHHDLQAQMDEDGEFNVCGGFLFLRSTAPTISLWNLLVAEHRKIVDRMKALQQSRQTWNIDAMTEQRILSNLLRQKANELQFKWKGLDRDLFPSGRRYFFDQKTKYSSQKQNGKSPVVIHVNYVMGYSEKLKKFQNAGLWLLDREYKCKSIQQKNRSVPQGKKTEKFFLRLKILTFDRPASLLRLLSSLSAAEYDGDLVSLDIYVDRSPSEKIVSEIMSIVNKFEWLYGPKYVHRRVTQVGVQVQWIEAWSPASIHEYAFFLEDDVQVSPFYYRWLKQACIHYHQTPLNQSRRLYGISLQRQYLIPARPGKQLKVDNQNQPFAYQLLGTWGLLMFPDSWIEFRKWYEEHRYSDFKPYLPKLITTEWYKKQGEKIWTPWFIYWAKEYDQYCLYTNFRENRCLSTCHREKGVNYASTVGEDCKLMKDEEDEMYSFPRSLLYFNYSLIRVE